MTAIVNNFKEINSRLRQNKEAGMPKRASHYLCHACDDWFSGALVTDEGLAYCPKCKAFNRCFFPGDDE